MLLEFLDNFLRTCEAIGSLGKNVGMRRDRDACWRGANNLVRASASGGPLFLPTIAPFPPTAAA